MPDQMGALRCHGKAKHATSVDTLSHRWMGTATIPGRGYPERYMAQLDRAENPFAAVLAELFDEE